jgi:hypothetical protein
VTATQGPCTAWDPIWCCDLSAASLAVTGTAVQAATEILYHLSGQRFGLCEITIRPCRHECWPGVGGWPGLDNWWQWGGLYPQPLLFDGVWSNLTCGTCGDRCSCTQVCEAWLPGPVNAITQVKLDGTVLVSGVGYRVDDFHKLVRLGGPCWPVCQDMTLADTEVGTWSVSFVFGEAVPVIGRYAVGELACEIARSCTGQACKLPANATQITRQGVTIDFPTYAELLQNGSLSLRWCDLFMATYNPSRLRAAPAVYDVDGPSFRRVGT